MDETTKLFIEMNARLASIDANLASCLASLQNHEQRIQKIENGKQDLKGDVVALLVKCLLVSVCATAALSGAGSILAKVFGK